jgi:hypothetical protein
LINTIIQLRAIPIIKMAKANGIKVRKISVTLITSIIELEKLPREDVMEVDSTVARATEKGKQREEVMDVDVEEKGGGSGRGGEEDGKMSRSIVVSVRPDPWSQLLDGFLHRCTKSRARLARRRERGVRVP